MVELQQSIDKQNKQQRNRAIGFALILLGVFIPIELYNQAWSQVALIALGGYFLIRK